MSRLKLGLIFHSLTRVRNDVVGTRYCVYWDGRGRAEKEPLRRAWLRVEEWTNGKATSTIIKRNPKYSSCSRDTTSSGPVTLKAIGVCEPVPRITKHCTIIVSCSTENLGCAQNKCSQCGGIIAIDIRYGLLRKWTILQFVHFTRRQKGLMSSIDQCHREKLPNNAQDVHRTEVPLHFKGMHNLSKHLPVVPSMTCLALVRVLSLIRGLTLMIIRGGRSVSESHWKRVKSGIWFFSMTTANDVLDGEEMSKLVLAIMLQSPPTS